MGFKSTSAIINQQSISLMELKDKRVLVVGLGKSGVASALS